jgi:hypothetical protein
MFPPRRNQFSQVSIGLFPQRKKVLIGLAAFSRVRIEAGRARETEVGERVARGGRLLAAMVNDVLELRRRFRARAFGEVRLAAQVRGPELGGGFIRPDRFEDLDGAGRVVAAQFYRGARDGEPDGLQGGARAGCGGRLRQSAFAPAEIAAGGQGAGLFGQRQSAAG